MYCSIVFPEREIMNVDLGEPKARGRMKANKENIIELRAKGYSFSQIAMYLENEGVKVTPDGVRKFILREESK